MMPWSCCCRGRVCDRRRVVCNCVCVEVSKAASSPGAWPNQKKEMETKKAVQCDDRRRKRQVFAIRSWVSCPVGVAWRTGQSLESRCTPPGPPQRRAGTWETHEPRARIARGSRSAKARRSGAERAAMRRGPRGVGSPGWCPDRKAWSSWLMMFARAQGG